MVNLDPTSTLYLPGDDRKRVAGSCGGRFLPKLCRGVGETVLFLETNMRAPTVHRSPSALGMNDANALLFPERLRFVREGPLVSSPSQEAASSSQGQSQKT